MCHEGCAALDCASCCPCLGRCELHDQFLRAAVLGLGDGGNFCAWRFERCGRGAAAARAGRPAPVALPPGLVELRVPDA